jgi:hypothetical protein
MGLAWIQVDGPGGQVRRPNITCRLGVTSARGRYMGIAPSFICVRPGFRVLALEC